MGLVAKRIKNGPTFNSSLTDLTMVTNQTAQFCEQFSETHSCRWDQTPNLFLSTQFFRPMERVSWWRISPSCLPWYRSMQWVASCRQLGAWCWIDLPIYMPDDEFGKFGFWMFLMSGLLDDVRRRSSVSVSQKRLAWKAPEATEFPSFLRFQHSSIEAANICWSFGQGDWGEILVSPGFSSNYCIIVISRSS